MSLLNEEQDKDPEAVEGMAEQTRAKVVICAR